MTTKFSGSFQTVRTLAARALQPAFQVESDSSADRRDIPELEMTSYQIGLVPFSAQSSENAGANTVMDKLLSLPLTWDQLIRRVRREVGGTNSANESSIVQFGQVRIDFLAMEVQRAERQVSLTAMEFKVLRFFVLNPNRVISRDELLNQVWGYDNYPCTRTVDNHVLKLRQKLEAEAAHPVHFRTVHGIGYKFVA